MWFELDRAHVITWDNSKFDPERLPEPPADGLTYTYDHPKDVGAAGPE